MSSRSKGFVAVLVAGSLCFSSTAAMASAPAPQINPWAALTGLSGGAPAAALCGAAAVAAAAQAAAPGCLLPVVDAAPVPTAPPPMPVAVPPVEPVGGGFAINPLILALGAVAAGALIYFLIHNNKDNDEESPS
jgi:hypothetical protein